MWNFECPVVDVQQTDALLLAALNFGKDWGLKLSTDVLSSMVISQYFREVSGCSTSVATSGRSSVASGLMMYEKMQCSGYHLALHCINGKRCTWH